VVASGFVPVAALSVVAFSVPSLSAMLLLNEVLFELMYPDPPEFCQKF
jgi:hypothetical protein